MKSAPIKTCYMCELAMSSREHVPPRSMFPQQHDTANGKDFRKQLIAVPSCHLHNGAKSEDDQYLMVMIASSFGSNEVAAHYVDTKIRRTLDENHKLRRQLQSGASPVALRDIRDGSWHSAMMMRMDPDRIHQVLEMNARAIYFHHHGQKLLGPINLKINFAVSMEGALVNDHMSQLFEMADGMLAQAPRHGANPEVFFYRTDREGALELLEFTFYDSAKALISIFHPAPES